MDQTELEQLAAALSGRYVLEGVAGRGTSATVFRAVDLRHDRPVALKLLHARRGAAVDGERFHREIRTAAHLQHPHILPLFDSGEAAGRLYYTMPYVETGTLRDRLRRTGPLTVGEALRLGRELAGALVHAHEAGVVHRDIKPENITLSAAGHAMLADFGIARAAGGGAASVTAEGLAIGTPAYMSPEQVTGQEPIDGRSDVYALGAVLYEALTGVPPFPGSDAETVMRRRLVEPAPSARAKRPEVPAPVDGILRKAMCGREERYQSAADFLNALTREEPGQGSRQPRWTRVAIAAAVLLAIAALGLAGRRLIQRPGPRADEVRMLVVLPFKNLGEPADQYFADGLTEEITSRLAGLSGLRVISRTSADQYRNSAKSLKQIGAELGASYVLEGSVRWDRSAGPPGRIRVTPQLIRVADDSHLWAERYDAELTQVLGIQSDIAERLTAALDVTFLERERASLAAGGTKDPEAYDLFLRGNDYFNRGYSQPTMRTALELYQKAVARDPRFALALARLSLVQTDLHWLGFDKSPDRLADARRLADSALQVAPDLPEGRWALGFYYYAGYRDYEHALEQLRMARRKQPSNAELIAAIARVERRQGQWEASLVGMAEAARYDPRASIRHFDLGATYLGLFRYAEAERALDRAIELAPEWAIPHVYKAQMYIAWQGDLAHASAALGSSLNKVGAGALAPVLISYDLVSGAPFTSESLFVPALDGLTLQNFEGDSSRYYLLKAESNRFRGRSGLERTYADSARVVVERWVRDSPDDVRHLADLSLAYAALGRRAAAVRAARRAVELVPPSRDAIVGPLLQARLARVHMMVGDPDQAIGALEAILAVPGGISPAELGADPVWAPLRNHPRFQRLYQPSPPAT